METSYVYLQCVKAQSKLRVRITSGGYFRDANCMFPRDLRVDGRRYRVPPYAVTLINSRGKYYYSITPRLIEVLQEAVDTSNIHVYEDEGTVECAICLTEPKSMVVNPCGHYYMCGTCATSVRTCPICRGPIASLINKSDMD
jgi:hypothetical protein